MTVQSKFKEGLALHQQGRLVQAQQIYQQILKIEPRHADTLHFLGMLARQSGNPAQAVQWIDKSLKISPDNAAAHSNLGNALSELNRYPEAIDSYDRAIALQPNHAEAYSNRGFALNALKQHQQAIDSYDRAIALKPDFAQAWCNCGIALHALQRPEEAVESFDRALAVQPSHAEAWFSRGMALHGLKQYQAALDSYNQAVAFKPDHAQAWCNCGTALNHLGQYQQAISSCDRALALMPDLAPAWCNRANALLELQQYQAAIDSYDKALVAQPTNVDGHFKRGNALNELNQYQAAIDSYDRAIALKPDFVPGYNNRGCAFINLRQHQRAMASFDQAIALQPDDARAWCNRGGVLTSLKQHRLALDSFDKAIALQPDYARAWCNRAGTLSHLKQHQEAMESYDRALALDPDAADVWSNRGNALNDLGQHQAAINAYSKALALKPDSDFALGGLLHAKMQICDWQNSDVEILELLLRIDRSERVTPSFPVLSLTPSPLLQRKAAEIWIHDKCPPNFELGLIPKHSWREKIRLGYFSMDFRNHPVAFLTAELFETHDRNKFEVYAFSFGPDTKDEMRVRLEAGFDQFIDVWDKSERDIAELARQMEIDIAIDLAGLTGDSRTGIFAHRAAPVQVSYLGYPGTMGASYMDYLIADRQLIPDEARPHYAEQIVFLPDTYMVNDTTRRISHRTFTREELGLPTDGFVFCCFNKSYKLSPSTFDVWMRILNQVAGSVLWLSGIQPVAADNLRKEAELRGVSAARLVFATSLPLLADHLARHRTADLFIDTLPYNAHTTASDALWAGLPVLTCVGESFASRVAASLLNAIGLPELITTTQADYEALAIELALNPERLKAIRQKLERNRLSTPLFDTQRFTRHLEDAYTQMLERYHADLPPDHIHVAPRPR